MFGCCSVLVGDKEPGGEPSADRLCEDCDVVSCRTCRRTRTRANDAADCCCCWCHVPRQCQFSVFTPSV